jgi:hypothetical protein
MDRYPIPLVLFGCLQLWKALDLRLQRAHTARIVLARRIENTDEGQGSGP